MAYPPFPPYDPNLKNWTDAVSAWALIVEKDIWGPESDFADVFLAKIPNQNSPGGPARLKEWARLLSIWALSVERHFWRAGQNQKEWDARIKMWAGHMATWAGSLPK